MTHRQARKSIGTRASRRMGTGRIVRGKARKIAPRVLVARKMKAANRGA